MFQKRIALFDIDKTIYDGYIIFALAEFQLSKNILNKECLNNLYNDLRLYKNKKVDYENTVENLNQHWAKGLKKNGALLDEVINETKIFIKNNTDKFFSYFPKVVKLLKKSHDIYFITGEPQFVGQTASQHFLIKGFMSSVLEVKKKLFTGKIKTSLAKREEKKKAIKKLFSHYGFENSFGFGDSEGDIEMLKMVQYPICINSTEGLKQEAKKNKWFIEEPTTVVNLIKNILSVKKSIFK